MRIERTAHFKKEFLRLPRPVQDTVVQAIETYVQNPRYPSLGVKKIHGAHDIWEMRVSQSYRITFNKIDEGILLRHVGTHDILREETR